MSRPDSPRMLLATLESFSPASCKLLSSRCAPPGPFLDLGLAVTGQLTQLPDRRRRHEAGPDQPVFDQLRDPPGVRHVALAARDVTHVLSVEQPAFHRVLQ